MELNSGIGDKAIKDIVKDYPEVGEILNKFEIGCVDCSVGICLARDVVAIHFLGDEIEAGIEKQINEYLAQRKQPLMARRLT